MVAKLKKLKFKEKLIAKGVILITAIMLSISGIVYSTGFDLEHGNEFNLEANNLKPLDTVGVPAGWTNVEITITQDEQYKIEDITSVGISVGPISMEKLLRDTLKDLNNKTQKSGIKQLYGNKFLFCTAHELKLPSYRSYDNPASEGKGIELKHVWGTQQEQDDEINALGSKATYSGTRNQGSIPNNYGGVNFTTAISGLTSVLRPNWGHGSPASGYRVADLNGKFLNLAYMNGSEQGFVTTFPKLNNNYGVQPSDTEIAELMVSPLLYSVTSIRSPEDFENSWLVKLPQRMSEDRMAWSNTTYFAEDSDGFRDVRVKDDNSTIFTSNVYIYSASLVAKPNSDTEDKYGDRETQNAMWITTGNYNDDITGKKNTRIKEGAKLNQAGRAVDLLEILVGWGTDKGTITNPTYDRGKLINGHDNFDNLARGNPKVSIQHNGSFAELDTNGSSGNTEYKSTQNQYDIDNTSEIGTVNDDTGMIYDKDNKKYKIGPFFMSDYIYVYNQTVAEYSGKDLSTYKGMVGGIVGGELIFKNDNGNEMGDRIRIGTDPLNGNLGKAKIVYTDMNGTDTNKGRTDTKYKDNFDISVHSSASTILSANRSSFGLAENLGEAPCGPTCSANCGCTENKYEFPWPNATFYIEIEEDAINNVINNGATTLGKLSFEYRRTYCNSEDATAWKISTRYTETYWVMKDEGQGCAFPLSGYMMNLPQSYAWNFAHGNDLKCGGKLRVIKPLTGLSYHGGKVDMLALPPMLVTAVCPGGHCNPYDAARHVAITSLGLGVASINHCYFHGHGGIGNPPFLDTSIEVQGNTYIIPGLGDPMPIRSASVGPIGINEDEHFYCNKISWKIGRLGIAVPLNVYNDTIVPDAIEGILPIQLKWGQPMLLIKKATTDIQRRAVKTEFSNLGIRLTTYVTIDKHITNVEHTWENGDEYGEKVFPNTPNNSQTPIGADNIYKTEDDRKLKTDVDKMENAVKVESYDKITYDIDLLNKQNKNVQVRVKDILPEQYKDFSVTLPDGATCTTTADNERTGTKAGGSSYFITDWITVPGGTVSSPGKATITVTLTGTRIEGVNLNGATVHNNQDQNFSTSKGKITDNKNYGGWVITTGDTSSGSNKHLHDTGYNENRAFIITRNEVKNPKDDDSSISSNNVNYVRVDEDPKGKSSGKQGPVVNLAEFETFINNASIGNDSTLGDKQKHKTLIESSDFFTVKEYDVNIDKYIRNVEHDTNSMDVRALVMAPDRNTDANNKDYDEELNDEDSSIYPNSDNGGIERQGNELGNGASNQENQKKDDPVYVEYGDRVTYHINIYNTVDNGQSPTPESTSGKESEPPYANHPGTGPDGGSSRKRTGQDGPFYSPDKVYVDITDTLPKKYNDFEIYWTDDDGETLNSNMNDILDTSNGGSYTAPSLNSTSGGTFNLKRVVVPANDRITIVVTLLVDEYARDTIEENKLIIDRQGNDTGFGYSVKNVNDVDIKNNTTKDTTSDWYIINDYKVTIDEYVSSYNAVMMWWNNGRNMEFSKTNNNDGTTGTKATNNYFDWARVNDINSINNIGTAGNIIGTALSSLKMREKAIISDIGFKNGILATILNSDEFKSGVNNQKEREDIYGIPEEEEENTQHERYLKETREGKREDSKTWRAGNSTKMQVFRYQNALPVEKREKIIYSIRVTNEADPDIREGEQPVNYSLRETGKKHATQVRPTEVQVSLEDGLTLASRTSGIPGVSDFLVGIPGLGSILGGGAGHMVEAVLYNKDGTVDTTKGNSGIVPVQVDNKGNGIYIFKIDSKTILDPGQYLVYYAMVEITRSNMYLPLLTSEAYIITLTNINHGENSSGKKTREVVQNSPSSAFGFGTGSIRDENITPAQNKASSEYVKMKELIIAGKVWLDEDKNGMKHEDEYVFKDIWVNLLNANTGKIIESVQTDSSGFYTFGRVYRGKDKPEGIVDLKDNKSSMMNYMASIGNVGAIAEGIITEMGVQNQYDENYTTNDYHEYIVQFEYDGVMYKATEIYGGNPMKAPLTIQGVDANAIMSQLGFGFLDIYGTDLLELAGLPGRFGIPDFLNSIGPGWLQGINRTHYSMVWWEGLPTALNILSKISDVASVINDSVNLPYAYRLDSNAYEYHDVRQKFNQRYETIAYNKALGMFDIMEYTKSGLMDAIPYGNMISAIPGIPVPTTISLEYDKVGHVSKLTEADRSGMHTSPQRKMTAESFIKKGSNSNNNDVKTLWLYGAGERGDFKLTETEYLKYINLGLVEREELDLSLTKDVYEVRTTINGEQITYTYDLLKEELVQADPDADGYYNRRNNQHDGDPDTESTNPILDFRYRRDKNKDFKLEWNPDSESEYNIVNPYHLKLYESDYRYRYGMYEHTEVRDYKGEESELNIEIIYKMDISSEGIRNDEPNRIGYEDIKIEARIDEIVDHYDLNFIRNQFNYDYKDGGANPSNEVIFKLFNEEGFLDNYDVKIAEAWLGDKNGDVIKELTVSNESGKYKPNGLISSIAGAMTGNQYYNNPSMEGNGYHTSYIRYDADPSKGIVYVEEELLPDDPNYVKGGRKYIDGMDVGGGSLLAGAINGLPVEVPYALFGPKKEYTKTVNPKDSANPDGEGEAYVYIKYVIDKEHYYDYDYEFNQERELKIKNGSGDPDAIGGIENIAQIGAYSTYYYDYNGNVEVAGLVDRDSNPGNLPDTMTGVPADGYISDPAGYEEWAEDMACRTRIDITVETITTPPPRPGDPGPDDPPPPEDPPKPNEPIRPPRWPKEGGFPPIPPPPGTDPEDPRLPRWPKDGGTPPPRWPKEGGFPPIPPRDPSDPPADPRDPHIPRWPKDGGFPPPPSVPTENENLIRYLRGKVWDDTRSEETSYNGKGVQYVGNGLYNPENDMAQEKAKINENVEYLFSWAKYKNIRTDETEEKDILVPNLKAEIIEIVQLPAGTGGLENRYYEEKMNENWPWIFDQNMRTDEYGEYYLSGFIPGYYIVRFSYGDIAEEEMLVFNGQDYKSTQYTAGAYEYKEDGTVGEKASASEYATTGRKYGEVQNQIGSQNGLEVGVIDEVKGLTGYDSNLTDQAKNRLWHYDEVMEALEVEGPNDARDDELKRLDAIAFSETMTNRTAEVLKAQLTKYAHYADKYGIAGDIKARLHEKADSLLEYYKTHYTKDDVGDNLRELVNKTNIYAETITFHVKPEKADSMPGGYSNYENTFAKASQEFYRSFKGTNILTQSLSRGTQDEPERITYNNYSNMLYEDIGRREYIIENIDFGIEYRPESQINLYKEINCIELITSDNETILKIVMETIDIDGGMKINPAEKPANGKIHVINQDKSIGLQNVQFLTNEYETNIYGYTADELKIWSEDLQGFVYINIDDEILQGCTIKIEYGLTATNEGEVDRINVNLDEIRYKENPATQINYETYIDYIVYDGAIADRSYYNEYHGTDTEYKNPYYGNDKTYSSAKTAGNSLYDEYYVPNTSPLRAGEETLERGRTYEYRTKLKLFDDRLYKDNVNSPNDGYFGRYMGRTYHAEEVGDHDVIVELKFDKILDYVDNNAVFRQQNQIGNNTLWATTTSGYLGVYDLLKDTVFEFGKPANFDLLKDKTGYITDKKGERYDTDQKSNLVISVDDSTKDENRQIGEVNTSGTSNSERNMSLAKFIQPRVTIDQKDKEQIERYSGHIDLVTSKEFATSADTENMQFENVAEVIQLSITNGRRTNFRTTIGNAEIGGIGRPGVTPPTVSPLTSPKGEFPPSVEEPDTSTTEQITLTPPTGFERDRVKKVIERVVKDVTDLVTENKLASVVVIVIAISAVGAITTQVILTRRRNRQN